ncbi:oxysterol binding protein [Schizosaccharomyces japonicus yFS275]|uniref:Oxysterol binding protein n=1 Tax=Schizosaccharomyces japonicus (strain yFS275 / FY16936) TaxID=402676 RepID=B6K2A7_SCHJY|nr:oxysterol binding protein [Schizosaccharomyces japonicus yFS275]EEB07288.1 oxysterol binding protein [Schizosaccharomyces japonicus yFS275]
MFSSKKKAAKAEKRAAVKKENSPQTYKELTEEYGEVEGTQKEESKFKLILSILRQCIGVKDLATFRFSLPSQLLEPVGNLEYWNYVDRPDYFAVMGDAEDEVGRMLGVLRWWFTKDIRFVRGRVVKPYNSTLGEFFRCRWVINEPAVRDDETIDPSSSQLNVLANPSTESTKYLEGNNYRKAVDTTAAPSGRLSRLSRQTAGSRASKPLRDSNSSNDGGSSTRYSTGSSSSSTAQEHVVVFMAEQTCHHPPVSAYYVCCPSKGVEVYGLDQIAAKFTGGSIRVLPGGHNRGVYVRFPERDNEEYLCTHPSGSVGGVLRGNMHINMHDSTFITCPKTGLKVILTYTEESWLGKPKSLVNGVIFKYDPKDDKYHTIKSVPSSLILAKFHGSWRNCIFYELAEEKKTRVLVDINELDMVRKNCPPLDEQLPFESRKIWFPVTENIFLKRYSKATREKIAIEDEQRKLAAEREKNNQKWVPRFFEEGDNEGRPTLSKAGRVALQRMIEGDTVLDDLVKL